MDAIRSELQQVNSLTFSTMYTPPK